MEHGHSPLFMSTGTELQVDLKDFPSGSVVKNLPASAGDMGSVSELGRCPGGGDGIPMNVLGRESHGQRSLAGYSPWGHKEPDTT